MTGTIATGHHGTRWFVRKCAKTHAHEKPGLEPERAAAGTRIRSRKLPSTHEPVHLLEPSDLLAPLDLSDRQADLFYRSIGRGTCCNLATGDSPGGQGQHPHSGQPTANGALRSKSILMVAGALPALAQARHCRSFKVSCAGDSRLNQRSVLASPFSLGRRRGRQIRGAAKSDEAKPTSGEAKPASSATPELERAEGRPALNGRTGNRAACGELCGPQRFRGRSGRSIYSSAVRSSSQ